MDFPTAFLQQGLPLGELAFWKTRWRQAPGRPRVGAAEVSL